MSIDPDIEHRLDDIEEKLDQNSKILRSIRRKQLVDIWITVIKICLFIGLFYYAYLFAEPLLIQVREAYISFQGLSDSVNSIKGTNVFDFFKPSEVPQQ